LRATPLQVLAELRHETEFRHPVSLCRHCADWKSNN
jgi:hypothetical protein